MPLDWTKSTASQGVAFMLLAERRSDATMAKVAVQPIEAALATLHHRGEARSVAFYEAQLSKAHALFGKLAKR